MGYRTYGAIRSGVSAVVPEGAATSRGAERRLRALAWHSLQVA